MPAEARIAPAPKAPPAKRDAKHEVSRTVHINKQPVDIDYAYDLDPSDPEGSAKRKEAAFSAALLKLYPTARASRGNAFWYTV